MDGNLVLFALFDISFAALIWVIAEAPIIRLKRLVQELRSADVKSGESDSSRRSRHEFQSFSIRFFASPFGELVLILYCASLWFLIGKTIEHILATLTGVVLSISIVSIALFLASTLRVRYICGRFRGEYRRATEERPLYDILAQSRSRLSGQTDRLLETKKQLTDALKALRFEYMSGHIGRDEYEEREERLFQSLKDIESQINTS